MSTISRKGLEVKRNYLELVSLNFPGLYQDPEFVEWLDRAATGSMMDDGEYARCATWHRAGEPVGEYSDVFITVDYCSPVSDEFIAEGSDTDMPEHCWDAIVEVLANAGISGNGCCLVWLKNLGG